MANDSPPFGPSVNWRAVVDGLTDPAVVIDRHGVIIHHNQLANDPFPRIRSGQPFLSIMRNPELASAIETARTLMQRVVIEIEERGPVRRRSAAVLAPIGEPSLKSDPPLLIIFRDLTEEQRLARMRSDFVANASHELRTPLASLKGFIETLQGNARDDAAARARFLAIMAEQAQRMTRLIEDLTSLSRAEMRMHLPPSGTVDLAEVADAAVLALEPIAMQRHVTIAIKKTVEPALVTGDRDELLQVAQNLIQNAVKYGREGGTIEVRVGAGSPDASMFLATSARNDFKRRRITLSVTDDGVGIAPDHLPRLTERFYRVNTALSRERGGTGLGLAIVKNIVQRHRGELRIASELGRGSVFAVGLDAAT